MLLATPPRVIAGLVRDVDRELSTRLDRIRDVALVTIALGYKRDDVRHPLAGSGFVVPSRERASVNAVTWMSSKWIGRAPEDRVLLRAAVGGARDPHAASLSEEDIVGRVRDDLRRYLQVSSAPIFTRVYRMPRAGVQLEVGHLNLMREAEARLEGLKGLFLSAAGLRGVGIADCVGDARTQAIAAADYVHTLRSKERTYASAAGC